MSETREAVVNGIKALREAAEAAGIVKPDPWASLDSVWKGPDVDLEKIAVLGDETLAAVRKAFVEGSIEEGMVNQVLDLAKLLLPMALTQL